MTEKNSLLGYLLVDPSDEKKIFCREMDEKRKINEYTYKDLMLSAVNLGRLFRNGEEWGDHIPLLLDTSFEFLQAFFGTLAGGKICVPMHTIAHEDSIGFILKKIRAKSLIVTQPWLYRKLQKIEYVHQHIHTIFCSPKIIEQKSLPCKHINLHEILNEEISIEEARKEIEEVIEKTQPDDTLQLVFTSGTTGEPKGAILSHRNVISCIVRAGEHLNIDSTYKTLTFLPLSHVMAQNEVFVAFIKRALVQFVSRDNLLHGLKNFEPNILVAVPRVYEAVHSGIERKLRSKKVARRLLNLSVKSYLILKKSYNPFKIMFAAMFFYTIGRIITGKVGEGIGKFKILVTAGAACPEHIYDFFEAIGLPLTNAQGLTEVSGAIIYNNPGKTYRNSIGFPLRGVEVKIADDGEILVKGDPVFCGYFEEPELNKETFTEDGFFRTGDLGRKEIYQGQEYVFLLGRKKEILVLSSGLNIPPVQIEDKLLKYPLIQQAVVIGDGQPRLAALIVPDEEFLENGNGHVREEISKIIRQVNMHADASEKIEQFEIIKEPFTVENGMLTPTMKVRRAIISQRYKDVIGRIYKS